MNSVRTCWYLVAFAVFVSNGLSAQLTIDNAINANAAVQNVLLGSGVTASNITFQGDNAQIGGFNCNSCGLGIGNGVVIGTGNVNGAEGPNDSGSFNQGPPSSNDGAGDTDLESLSGMLLNNTAVLEFDFVPTGDSLAFNYVFSSEEYPEYVNSINDAFGFFLSGPGITGPYSNSAMNIALIPGTTTPISINTVNAGENSAYFVDNAFDVANVQANAFTTVLTAYAEVICGQNYHIKIVIGDASDYMYDSWVFLEAGSFQSNVLTLNYSAPNYSSPADGGVYEGCQAGNLIFTRSGVLDSELAYGLTFAGDAIIGTDIDFPYTEIIFPAGESEVTLSFQAIQDFVLEGIESLEITMQNSGCGSSNASVTIQVYDLPALQVSVDDALINCGDMVTFEPVITGGLGDYTVLWEGNTEALTYTVTPDAATVYSYTVSDTCGVIPVNGQASVTFIQNPPLVVEASDNLTATCLDVQNFQPQISGGLPPYEVEWYVNGALESVNTDLLFSSGESVELEFVVTDWCGVEESDIFQYAVPDVPILIDLGDDLVIQCIDEVVYEAAPSGGVGNYMFDWLIDNASQSNTQNFSEFFNADAVLRLEVSDQCGNSTMDEVYISVPPIPVTVTLPDDIYTNCLETSILEPEVSGGAGNLDFSWIANGTPFSTSASVNYTTGIDALISLSVEDECGNSGTDAMTIFIPTSPIDVLVPADTIICLYDGVLLEGSAMGGVGELILSWDGGSDQAEVYVTPLEPTSYRLYVEDECGNFSSASVFVNIDYIEPNFTSVYVDDEVVSLTNALPDSIVTFWEFSDGTISNDHNAIHRFNTINEWVATLHAYSSVGCHNEVSQTFQATGTVFIPCAFSPNGDGINDFWKPVGRDLLSYYVRIFSRNGDVIFESRDMDEVWLGNIHRGEYYVPDGVYSYILQASDARYNAFERSGYIQVFR